MRPRRTEQERLATAWRTLLVVLPLCTAVVLLVPSMREIARLDLQMLFPHEKGDVLIGGLGRGCRPSELPVIDTATRSGEFTMMHPDWEAIDDVANRWFRGTQTIEDEVEGPGVAVGYAIVGAFRSGCGTVNPEKLERVLWAQRQEPTNGLLWLAEQGIRGRMEEDLCHEPPIVHDDRSEMDAAARIAVTKLPWDAHLPELMRTGLRGWEDAGMPSYEAVHTFHAAMDGHAADVRYELEQLAERLPEEKIHLSLIRSPVSEVGLREQWLDVDLLFLAQTLLLSLVLVFACCALPAAFAPARDETFPSLRFSLLESVVGVAAATWLATRAVLPFFGDSCGFDYGGPIRYPSWSVASGLLWPSFQFVVVLLAGCWTLRAIRRRDVLLKLVAAGLLWTTGLIAISARDRAVEVENAITYAQCGLNCSP